MKILVTGGKGMLGGDFCRLAARKHQLTATDIDELDVCNAQQLMEAISSLRPQVVVHLAAMTDVDRCETEVETAYRINAVGTRNVAVAAHRFGAELVYVSTASIFDGKRKEPYNEFDPPGPISIYARSKYQGELFVRTHCLRHYIVRAGWLFGGGIETDKKFVGKIIRLAQQKKSIKVVHDKIGTPTFSRDLSEGILKLIESGLYGTYHMGNLGACSRLDYARHIIKTAGIDCELLPCTSEEYPLPAHRPDMEAVDNLMLRLTGLHSMRPWQEALTEYVRTLLKQ
jgi:dTDP-4-dehydrorhamnose reductase